MSKSALSEIIVPMDNPILLSFFTHMLEVSLIMSKNETSYLNNSLKDEVGRQDHTASIVRTGLTKESSIFFIHQHLDVLRLYE